LKHQDQSELEEIEKVEEELAVISDLAEEEIEFVPDERKVEIQQIVEYII